MKRFGTVIELNKQEGYAVVRENTRHGRSFLVMNSELSQVSSLNKFETVSFQRDTDFRKTRVAKNLQPIHSTTKESI